jgi:hypothetical protein
MFNNLQLLNYDVNSDEEWEDEPNDAEDCNSDDEDEDEVKMESLLQQLDIVLAGTK